MTAFLALLPLLQIQVRDEPKDWRRLATEHFDVYYPSDDLLPRARQFAGWFEDGRARLLRQTGIEPPRVHVFLYRSYHDLLQASFLGRSEPLRHQIRGARVLDRAPERPLFCRPNARSRALALAEPLRNRIFIHCQASDRWNAWFARHELAHQVQFEHLFPWRLPGWLVAAKEPLIPFWYWEGGADYLAGLFGPDKDEYMRDLAGERLYDLKELFHPDILNPYDYRAIYYQGSYFWRFLDERYGAGTGRTLFHAYDEGLPLPSQKPLESLLQKPREEIEREFADHLREGWRPMLAGRGHPTDRLTDSLAYFRRRAWGGRWSPDGKRLAWISDADSVTDLYVDGDAKLGWRRGFDTGMVVSAPSWSPDGRRLAVVEWTLHRRDALVLVDVEGGIETVDLEFDELYDPAWSPDGRRIAFTALKSGTSDLYVLHLDDRRVERLTNDPAADQAPAWSRDGRLAFVKETDGRTVLHVLDRGPVTTSWATIEHPQWSPDGKSIVVAADVDGIFDAFAVDPETGAARRLTRFAGGVSYPSCHPDGSIVFTYTRGRGQDLYRARSQPQDEPAFNQESRQDWHEQFRPPPPAGEPAEKSRVWGVDWAMFPVTSVSFAIPGAELMIGDRDAENRLFAAGGGLSSRAWTAGAIVTNTRWRPTFGAAAFAERTRDLEELSAEPFVDLPLLPTLAVGTGWTGRERREIEDDAPDPEVLDQGPSLSLLFSDQTSYSGADPTRGLAFGVTAAWFRDGWGGERDLNEYFAFAEAAWAVSHDWILWGRVRYEKLVGVAFLESELLEIEDAVRGAEEIEGIESGSATLELRFPLWRDLLWKPLELAGLGEWLVIKDLRGYVFVDAGFAGLDPGDAFEEGFGAVSAGVGVRLDFSWMAWPVVNARVPLRVEAWWAAVGQDDRPVRGEAGVSLLFGF